MSGLADFQTIPPNDFSFYEYLDAIIQEEPLDFIGPVTRGQIAAIGIVKGQPFQPTADEAAPHRGRGHRQRLRPRQYRLPRDPGHRYYPDTGASG